MVLLIVDDDSAVRSLVRAILERSGFQVRQAAGGAEALALLAGAAEPFELLLTDIVMPGMSGLALAARAHHDNASLPILFMSAFATEYSEELSGSVCLCKPFSAAQLLAAVDDVLRTRNRAGQLQSDRG